MVSRGIVRLRKESIVLSKLHVTRGELGDPDRVWFQEAFYVGIIPRFSAV
jgi:hypothetical protein